MPQRIHRLYLLDQEPNKDTIQAVMKEEVGDCRDMVWREEDRTRYRVETPDNPGLFLTECVTVIVGYVKNESKKAIRAIKTLNIPFEGQELNDRKIREAVVKAVGDVNIIDWRKANPIQRVDDSPGANQGKYQVQKDAEIVVRYMGGESREAENGKGSKHRLLFKHEIPDDNSVRARMSEEVGNCIVLRWYKDETMPPNGQEKPGMARIIVEYKEKR